MSDSISFVETDKISKSIDIILRQTDYTEEVARKKLEEYNYDHMVVIRAYFGIAEKKALPAMESLNQEIYKQMRYKLDGVMRDYNVRKENSETKLK
jgi:hypothetical protein